MAREQASALHAPGSDTTPQDRAADFRRPVKERPPAPRHTPEPTAEEAQEVARLIEKIDEITSEIEGRLAEDIAHAESSRLELDRILKEIRLKQESIDKTLGLTG